MYIKINTLKELENNLSYLNTDSFSVIEKAYDYAFKKHLNQKRLSGEDYIIHPLNVAFILSTIHADCDTITAALLHDIVEETDTTLDELESEFGPSISKLVDGITKINKLNLSKENDSEISTQRKILVGMTEDVRVIFLKLADRLHNMRTLWALPVENQKANAKETLDILTPIAHRLGIGSIKSELEDLSLRYLKPDVYFQIVEQVNATKKQRDMYVSKMIESVSNILNEHGIKHEIKGRSKSIYSIYKKLDKGKKFNEIYDFLALRVFVSKEEECYQALGYIHSKFKPMPKRFKDYIAMPKTNMYQSLHTTVFGIDERIFEIQIRTYEMDKVAENGIASHWSYKEGKSDMQNSMEQKLQFFRVLMDLNTTTDDNEYMKSVKEDILNDNIYVFTPKGDVIELPIGSTPIDFAYRVHSKVGDTMVSAIVNDNIVPLDYELKDNDIIKINTNKNQSPSYEWINMCKTTGAKNKIKSYLSKNEKSINVLKGEEILKSELKRRKIPINSFYKEENLSKILHDIKCTDISEVYILLATNKINIESIFEEVKNDTKEDLILKKTNNKVVTSPMVKGDIIVDGTSNIKVNLASCCKPVYEDKIVGYITKGNGITVHRISCPNISEVDSRIIDVAWLNVSKKYPTTLLIRADGSKNMLVNIIAKTSNTNIVVESIKTLQVDELYEITVLTSSVTELNKYIFDLEMLSSIISVERKFL